MARKPREKKFSYQRWLSKKVETDRRATLKAHLAKLKDRILAARLERREALAGVRSDCKLKREELRQSCALRRARTKAQMEQEIAARKADMTAERRADRELRHAINRKPIRAVKVSTGRQRQKERREEDDEQTRNNLDPQMKPVFDAVKKQIKGSARRTRTEAFLEWAHENPDLVLDLQMRREERELAKLLREHARTERALQKKHIRSADLPDLADVPF